MQHVIECDREQVLLMPPSLREVVPEGRFAWFVLAALEEMDPSASTQAVARMGMGGARTTGDDRGVARSRPCRWAGDRRGIEPACVEDVAYRVIAANQVPNHCTIARFRQRHQDALSELFSEVLALCAEAGLVKVGVVAVDGTRLHADASCDADHEQIAEPGRGGRRRSRGGRPPR
jgi:hypothetical protein